LISQNFGHANCEVGWEFGNYKHKVIKLIGNRPIKFGSFASKLVMKHQNIETRDEIPNQVPKQVRKLQTILAVDNMSDSEEGVSESVTEFRDESELVCWISEFKSELEPIQQKQIYDILKANGFTTCLKLKLSHEDKLNIMFNTGSEVLPLGAKTLLSYKLNMLREDSPLVSKSKSCGRAMDNKMEMKDETSNTHKKVSAYEYVFYF
jgi:hypothetical protein